LAHIFDHFPNKYRNQKTEQPGHWNGNQDKRIEVPCMSVGQQLKSYDTD